MKTTSIFPEHRLLALILSAILLSGCAQSRQELIDEARFTGNWTPFDKRIAAMDKHEERNQELCPTGTKLWCVKRLRDEKCSCISDDRGREMFERLTKFER